MTRAQSILATLAAASALAGAGAVAVVSSGASGNARDMSMASEAKMLVAQAVPEQPAPPPGSTVPGPRTSLAQAIGAAEKQTGGRAEKAGMQRKRGTYLYAIKTLSKDRSSKVFVDPASGSVVRVEEPGLIGRVTSLFDRDDQWQEQALLTGLERSPMTLAGAITAAEKETGGRAVRAASVDQFGAVLFEVRLVKEATMLQARVDSNTGKVVTLPTPATRADDD
jgi:uncharacterized membrane protein YkoI